MTNSKINLTEFRKQYNIPADDTRSICKMLGYSIVREGVDQFIVGSNPYNVSNEYYLKHAVMEYRGSMNINRTLLGDFFEYEVKTDDGVGKIGVSTFDDDAVSPIATGLKKKPNKETKSVLLPRNKGAELLGTRAAELMMRRTEPPAGALTAPTPVAGMDALQVLVSALTAAQQAPAPAPAAPLQAQEELLKAVEKKFLLTTEQVGLLLGMSKGTISSKKSGFRKLGFEFEKVKEGSATLWKVSQY
jgi:hypothetical protein